MPHAISDTHMSKPPGIRSGTAAPIASLMPSMRMYIG